MKILTSLRDSHFQKWNVDDWSRTAELSSVARFDYVPVKMMQRGDITPASQEWLRKNKEQNENLLKMLHESIPRDGMFSPLILVSVHHKCWEDSAGVGKTFWLSIPFVIQSGNNRYKVAMEYSFTHISSIVLGTQADPRVFKYLQDELKKPLTEPLYVNKDSLGLQLYGAERGVRLEELL